MKTLELNQMEKLLGGGCLENMGGSFLFGLLVGGPLLGLAGAYLTLKLGDDCINNVEY